MLGRQNSGLKNIGKNVLTAAIGQIAIKPLHFGQATAQHNNLRVENVDNASQCPPEPVFVALQRRFAGNITSGGALLDFCNRQVLAGAPEMVSA